MDHGRGLDIWGNYDHVFPEVQLEGVPCPVALSLHDIEGHPPQEIFEHGPNLNAVALQQFETGCLCCLCHPVEEFGLGAGTARVHGLVCK
jgi:hypothetical protein